jgi:hypothetical protein
MKIKQKQEKKHRSILPGAIFAAFAASLIVYVVLLHVEKNALSAYEKALVVTAAQDIEKGTVITSENVNQYFQQTEMDKTLIPKAAITEDVQMIGQYVPRKIDQGAVMTISMAEPMETAAADMRRPMVAAFRTEELYQVTNGILRDGDKIHIYKVEKAKTGEAKTGEAQDEYGQLLWENVLVWQVFDSAGVRILPGDKTTAAARVNILLDQGELERFYGEITEGTLRIAKVWE